MTAEHRPDPSRLRVAWLTPGFPLDHTDPRYVFLAREASSLASTGEVELLVLSEGEEPSQTPSGVSALALERPTSRIRRVLDVVSYGRSSWLAAQVAVRSPKSRYGEIWRSAAILRELRQFRPHVVHSHFAVPEGTCGVAVASAARAASVVSLRGVDLATSSALQYGFRLDRPYDERFRQCIGHVDLCLTATSQMHHLALAAGAPPVRSEVLPNLLDPDWHQSTTRTSPPSGSELTVLSVGGLRAWKGFDSGVRALPLLPENIHYVIVGDGPEREALHDLALELKVDHRLHLTGALPPDEVAAWMQTASCYWFTSRWEAFGNVVVEAFASGLPIVATRLGVAADLLQGDAGASLLIDPGNPRELADATLRLLKAGRISGRDLTAFDSSARSINLLAAYHRAIDHASHRRELNP